MRLITILAVLLFCATTVAAQVNYEVTTTREASYPGGDEALYTFLHKEMQYPKEAEEKGIQGDVYVSFFVEADGTVSDVKTLSDLGGGTKEEAIRVVKLLKFTPALQNGKPIRQNMMLPVLFRIAEK